MRFTSFLLRDVRFCHNAMPLLSREFNREKKLEAASSTGSGFKCRDQQISNQNVHLTSTQGDPFCFLTLYLAYHLFQLPYFIPLSEAFRNNGQTHRSRGWAFQRKANFIEERRATCQWGRRRLYRYWYLQLFFESSALCASFGTGCLFHQVEIMSCQVDTLSSQDTAHTLLPHCHRHEYTCRLYQKLTRLYPL